MRCEGFWAGAGSRAMQSSSGPRPPAARRATWFVGLGSVSPPGPLGHVAAAEPVLGAKPVEDTVGRVALLAQLLQILLQPLVDDLGEPVQLRAPNRYRPPIARRHLKTTASSLRSRAKSRNDAPRRARSFRPGKRDEPFDKVPRYACPRPPRRRKGLRKELKWQSVAPPAARQSRRYRGLISHHRSHLDPQRDLRCCDIRPRWRCPGQPADDHGHAQSGVLASR